MRRKVLLLLKKRNQAANAAVARAVTRNVLSMLVSESAVEREEMTVKEAGGESSNDAGNDAHD